MATSTWFVQVMVVEFGGGNNNRDLSSTLTRNLLKASIKR